MGRAELFDRIQAYANRNGLVVGKQLGFGVHGIVFDAQNQSKMGLSAIKAHEREADYIRERDVYLRLQENAVTEIRGCNVPRLLNFDDSSLILEITVVSRPFVLDFGGAFLDQAPGFPDEVLAEWHAEKMEQFGKRWPEAQAILRFLEDLGIYVVDVNPNNISWLD
jgi:hypothetical protein